MNFSSECDMLRLAGIRRELRACENEMETLGFGEIGPDKFVKTIYSSEYRDAKFIAITICQSSSSET
jgi:hypothetical protein